MTLPRLLAGVDRAPITYDRHVRVHGDLAAGGSTLATTIERSGLRGRGGGGFPLAIKLAAVRRAGGTPIVIVNGCEGEPMSTKDRLLLTATPRVTERGIARRPSLVSNVETLAHELTPQSASCRPRSGNCLVVPTPRGPISISRRSIQLRSRRPVSTSECGS